MNAKRMAGDLLVLAKDVLGMEFPTQDALDKYLKDHPGADRSKHRVKKDPKDETPDEVEERLKKKMGPAYRTQEQRMEDAKPKHGPAQEPKKDWGEAAFGDYLDEVDSKTKTTQAQMDYIADCQEQGISPEECAKSIKDGSWKESQDKPSKDKGFVYKPKPHKKVTPTAKSVAKVKNVLKEHGLTDESDELQELAGFKRTLGQRVPESKKGEFYVRNEAKLKKDFIANMDPSNYDSRDAFEAAKKRMQAMPVSDFGKILAAISDEDVED